MQAAPRVDPRAGNTLSNPDQAAVRKEAPGAVRWGRSPYLCGASPTRLFHEHAGRSATQTDRWVIGNIEMRNFVQPYGTSLMVSAPAPERAAEGKR